MTAEPEPAPRLPPRFVIRAAWVVHRAVYGVTGGRRGLRQATPDQWGMMRLRTVGRRSGAERTAILGYFEDGPNLVTMAMNGWADPEPAWWLNLLANPDATVDLRGPPARSVPVQPIRTSGHACGPRGPCMTRDSTSTRPAAHARRRW